MSWEQAVSWLRSQPNQVALTEACYYDDPIEKAAARFVASEEFQDVLKLASLKPNSNVLDFGAGRGIASFGFASLGHTVTALEPDPSNLVGRGAIRELCQQTGVQIHLSAASAESIDSADNQYDLAYCRAALHHASSLADLCREIYRVLKPGGMLLATREHVLSQESDLQTFLHRHALHHLYGGEMAYTLASYRNAIENAGLKLVKILGPRQSIINAFPSSSESIQQESRTYLRAKLGFIGSLIYRLPTASKATTYWLDHRDNQPGRHYSFMAIKPVSP